MTFCNQQQSKLQLIFFVPDKKTTLQLKTFISFPSFKIEYFTKQLGKCKMISPSNMLFVHLSFISILSHKDNVAKIFIV